MPTPGPGEVLIAPERSGLCPSGVAAVTGDSTWGYTDPVGFPGHEFSGDVIEVGDAEVRVLSTPGHTTGAISLLVGDVLLSGDSLFLDGTPRPDLQSAEADPRGLAEQLHESLTERLAGLPEETTVAPGHVPPERTLVGGLHADSLSKLRERIPAFSQDRETFVERILDSLGSPPANYERIIAVNLGQERVSEDDAFELELGPNNCAVAAE